MQMSTNGYEALIQALCKKEDFTDVLRLVNEMASSGLKLSISTCSVVARGFQTAGDMDKSVKLLESIIRFRWVSNSTCLSDLLDGNLTDADLQGDRNNEDFEDLSLTR